MSYRKVAYIPILPQPRSLLRMPRQCRAPITEQPKVDLGAHIQRYDI